MNDYVRGVTDGMVSILAKGAKFTREDWTAILFLKVSDIPPEERERRLREIVNSTAMRVLDEYGDSPSDKKYPPLLTIDEYGHIVTTRRT